MTPPTETSASVIQRQRRQARRKELQEACRAASTTLRPKAADLSAIDGKSAAAGIYDQEAADLLKDEILPKLRQAQRLLQKAQDKDK